MLNQQINISILILLASIKISYGNQLIECYPADTCHAIGVDLFYQGKYIESIHFSNAAAKLRLKKNDSLLWKSYRNIGTTYFVMGLHQEAKKYYIKAYETTGKKTASDSVQLLRDLGTSLSELGELDQALEHGRKVILIDPQDPSVHAAYAAILKFGNDSIKLLEAIRHAEIAIQLCRAFEIDVNIKEVLIQAISEKGNALNMLGRYNEALKFYEEGLLQISNIDLDYQASILNNIATVLFEKKEHDLAIQKLKISLNLLFQYNEKTEFSYDYAGDHENLADNYTDLQQFDTALFHYQKALINLTNNFRNKDIFLNPNPKDKSLFVYSYIDMIRVLDLKATTAYQFYQQNNNPKYLTLANQTYQTAFNFHDKLQKDISTENSRLFQAKNIVPYIENALNIAYQQQQNGQEISKSAFRFMEKNKATVLLQSMNEADALQFANLPDRLLEQEKDLKIAISFHKKQLNEAIEYEDSTEIDRLDKVLFDKKQLYQQLINNLENNYTKYYRLKYKQNTSHLANIQKQLNNKTAILEYFVGDSSIFILSIQKDNSTLYKFQKPNNWNTVVDKFISSLNIDSIKKYYKDDQDPILFNDFTISATQLFSNLLAQPLKVLGKGDKITHLQIIPDAKLNYIPFELLLTNNNFPKGKVNYKNLPYLIKEKTISYAYSAALLLEGKYNIEPFYKYQYAGFAPNYENNEDYDTLNATKDNVTNISNGQGISFVDNEAAESNFKDNIHLCQTFQFAGHGDIDDNNPLNSKLIFTKTNDTADYELHAYELYNLTIPAQLGVLSACETGLGKTAKGEGIMSLSRAFIYAGCNSLVMSLWSIYDVQTADIVERFFAHLKKGKAKDEALRQAKLDYLHKTKTRTTHPIYWAGLVQIGDTSPLIFDNNCPFWLLLMVIVLFIPVAWLFLKRKKIENINKFYGLNKLGERSTKNKY